MRWLVLAIGAVTLLLSGCSGLSVLMVRNLSGGDLAITVLSNEPHHGEGYEKQLPAGAEVETLHWFSWAPEWIEITARGSNGVMEKKWRRSDYPPEMQEGSSAPTYYVLEIHENEMLLRDPTTWDAVRRNPIGYGLLVAIPVGVALAVLMALRRAVLERGKPNLDKD
jgi:hypothetical protein